MIGSERVGEILKLAQQDVAPSVSMALIETVYATEERVQFLAERPAAVGAIAKAVTQALEIQVLQGDDGDGHAA